MTIRSRIIIGFLLASVLLASSILIYTTYSMRDTAEKSYSIVSEQQLKLMTLYLSTFFSKTETDAALLAESNKIGDMGHLFPNYSSTSHENIFLSADLTDQAKTILEPFTLMQKNNPEYLEIFAGFTRGEFLTTDDLTLPRIGSKPLRPSPEKWTWFCREAGGWGGKKPFRNMGVRRIILSCPTILRQRKKLHMEQDAAEITPFQFHARLSEKDNLCLT